MRLGESSKPDFSDPRLCGHCGNYAPMKKGATYSTVQPVWDEMNELAFDEGDIYEILECPSCKKVNLTKLYYHEALSSMDDGPVDLTM